MCGLTAWRTVENKSEDVVGSIEPNTGHCYVFETLHLGISAPTNE